MASTNDNIHDGLDSYFEEIAMAFDAFTATSYTDVEPEQQEEAWQAVKCMQLQDIAASAEEEAREFGQ